MSWCDFCQTYHSSASCFHPGKQKLNEANARAERAEAALAKVEAENAELRELIHEQDAIYMGHYVTVQEIRRATDELFAFIELHADKKFLAHAKTLMEFRARILPAGFPVMPALAAHRARVEKLGACNSQE